MTGKTITKYLEEYRVNQSFSLVQSGRYPMTQIADMVGFSNASRFAGVFGTVRVQSRRIQFFEAAETEKGLCRVFINRARFENCDSALVVI